MESHYQVDHGAFTTTFDGYDTIPKAVSNRPKRAWKFVDEFEQLLGEGSEPDSLFFVESWTFGMASAVENYQQRRKKQVGRAFEDLDTLTLHEDEFSAASSEGFDAAGFTDPFASTNTWPSIAESAPRVLSQGLHEDERFEEIENFPEPAYPMTFADACQLLDVTPASSRQQIKAAYRRKVSQWHPDRLARGSEALRGRATAQMAAINEAYRLLGSGASQKSL